MVEEVEMSILRNIGINKKEIEIIEDWIDIGNIGMIGEKGFKIGESK